MRSYEKALYIQIIRYIQKGLVDLKRFNIRSLENIEMCYEHKGDDFHVELVREIKLRKSPLYRIIRCRS